jgi:MFS family permease
VERSSRLGLIRRSPAFGLLFVATAGSSFGTYIAAVALTLHISDITGSPVWVAGLLIADFLPIVVIGMLLGPLVDRLSRRWLMIGSDIARFGVFAVLPFTESPGVIVALAAVSGIATGFFRPAAFAGLPNLVPDEELTNANSLLQTIETLAWMIGPIVGALMYTAWGPDVPYAVNALTFLVSIGLIAGISEKKLRSEESLTRGHWRDVADGLRLVIASAPLRTVLIVWNVVLLASAAINVAEVFFARETLDAGDVGFGVIVAASGVGLALGSYLAAPSLGRAGLRRNYAGSIALMGAGWGLAAFSTSIWVAIPFIVAGAAGNGAAIVCNQLLVQRGAPDRYRGRALATIMSSNYAVLGLAMGGAGLLTAALGARWVWLMAGGVYVLAAAVAFLMTRWLPVGIDEQERAVEAAAVEAASGIDLGTNGRDVVQEPVIESMIEPVSEPVLEPEPDLVPDPGPEPIPASPAPVALEPVADGRSANGLERIATLLEQIEERRQLEARRTTK